MKTLTKFVMAVPNYKPPCGRCLHCLAGRSLCTYQMSTELNIVHIRCKTKEKDPEDLKL